MKKDLFLVIDMQNVYGEGGQWCCKNTMKASRHILNLLESHKDMDVIFTKFLASGDPVGVWKQYNKENKEVNSDPYANAMIKELEAFTRSYPVYVKSTYSSLNYPGGFNSCRRSK